MKRYAWSYRLVFLLLPIQVLFPCWYGLRQASRQWYANFSLALSSRGYTHFFNDTLYLFFLKKTCPSIIFLVVYVDENILIGDDEVELLELKAFLDSQFKIKDFDALNYFIGIKWVLSLMPCFFINISSFQVSFRSIIVLKSLLWLVPLIWVTRSKMMLVLLCLNLNNL